MVAADLPDNPRLRETLSLAWQTADRMAHPPWHGEWPIAWRVPPWHGEWPFFRACWRLFNSQARLSVFSLGLWE